MTITLDNNLICKLLSNRTIRLDRCFFCTHIGRIDFYTKVWSRATMSTFSWQISKFFKKYRIYIDSIDIALSTRQVRLIGIFNKEVNTWLFIICPGHIRRQQYLLLPYRHTNQYSLPRIYNNT